MNLVIDDEGLLYTAVIGIEQYNLDMLYANQEQLMLSIFSVIDGINEAISKAAIDARESMGKGFKVGDRVAAYNHKGLREGKGTVIVSRDKRLLNYIHVELDSGYNAYFRADLCKKLVKKKE